MIKLLIGTLVCMANFSNAASKPNVIYIIADDLAYGDLYLLAGTATDVPTSPSPEKVPDVPGERWDPTQPFRPAKGAERSANHENPHGEWTTAEFYVLGQQPIHVVNGHVVLSLDNARLNDGTPLVKGKLQIQSEGAEVYYRNIRIRPITAFPPKLLTDSKLPTVP